MQAHPDGAPPTAVRLRLRSHVHFSACDASLNCAQVGSHLGLSDICELRQYVQQVIDFAISDAFRARSYFHPAVQVDTTRSAAFIDRIMQILEANDVTEVSACDHAETIFHAPSLCALRDSTSLWDR